jgi:hypothetical protein
VGEDPEAVAADRVDDLPRDLGGRLPLDLDLDVGNRVPGASGSSSRLEARKLVRVGPGTAPIRRSTPAARRSNARLSEKPTTAYFPAA